MSLKDQAFTKTLLTNLHEQRASKQFTDFTIFVKNKPITAHKSILAAASHYFKALFSSDLSEAQEEKLQIDRMDFDAVQKMVDYFYTATVDITEENVKQIVEVSEYFQVVDLKQLCKTFIEENVRITPANCQSWKEFSSLYNLEDIASKAKKMTQSMFIDVTQSDEFMNLSSSKVIQLIKDNEINVPNEDPVLKACLDWFFFDQETRKEDLDCILRYVHLHYCSSHYLHHVLTSFSFLKENPKLHQIILDAFMKLASPERMVSTRRNCPRKSFEKASELLLVVGGELTGSIPNRTVFQHSSSRWTGLMSLDESVFFAKSSVCNTEMGIFISGGMTNDNQPVSSCHLLKWSSRKLYSLPAMRTGRAAHGSVQLNDSVYVFGGGCSENEIITDVDAINLKTEAWSVRSPMLYPIVYPIATSHGMEIYVLAQGCEDNEAIIREHGLLQCYNSVTDRWSLKSPLPKEAISAYGSSCVTLGDNIYVVGGENRLCYEYAVLQDSWTKLQCCSHIHIIGSAVVYQGDILICGGDQRIVDADSPSDAIECFDMTTNEWKVLDIKLPLPMSSHTIMVVKN